jgi:hypothetical protein
MFDGLPQVVEIGPWIDELLRLQSEEVIHYDEKSMELLHLFEDVYIPTTDDFGNITWGHITAVTRHDPGAELFEIKTKSGRSVIVTESKSLIIWNEEKQVWEEIPTSEVMIGDKVPVTLTLPDYPHSIKTLSKSKFEFCYNNGVFLGLFFAENPNKYLTASQIKFFQEWMPVKQVPNECFTANIKFVKGILSSYFAMDGDYMGDKFGVQSQSEIFLEGIALLCSRFDIFTHWDKREDKFVLYIDNYTLDFVNDTVLDPIVEITKVDVSNYPKVYDLTVPSTLNFSLANGLHVRDTATSGYIQRRMIKIAEDIQVKYDGTVRNSANSIIQMSYGDNFLDPTKTVFMKSKPLPCNISRIIQKINFSHEQQSH